MGHIRVGKGDPPEKLKEGKEERVPSCSFLRKDPAGPRHWLNSSGCLYTLEAFYRAHLIHT